MKLIDISMNINPAMAVYKNDPKKKPVFTVLSDYSNSTSYGSKIEMEMHCGTHLDMPLHMVEGGKTTDDLKLEPLIGTCKVIDLTNVHSGITKEDLQVFQIEEGDFILLKTRNSFEEHFNPDFIYLEHSGGQYLGSKKIRGVGIDGLGIERSQPGHETHLALLNQEIIIIEGLRLSHVNPGNYQLIALPLKIDGVEAAPLRAVLIDNLSE